MDAVNLTDFEALARERLEPACFDYVAGGAADEVTLRQNRAAFERLTLVPRVLVDVSKVDLSADVLGRRVEWPVLLAPTAFQRLVHVNGELATARAAATTATLMVASTMSSFTLEEVASAAPGPKWFQLYCYRDRTVTRRLVERAEAAGYQALCLTADLPRVGRRERDLRNGLRLTADLRPRNFEGLVHVRDDQFADAVSALIDPSLTWEVAGWLRSITSLPLLIKGILCAADARLAVEHGFDGIVVSNHGGRQLDGVPATIEVLEEVVGAVGGRCDVLLDGGVRRGTDVVKALALGARAVLIGRPYVWGLAVGGEAGVKEVLDLLRGEVELALALLGCRRVGEVSREHVLGRPTTWVHR